MCAFTSQQLHGQSSSEAVRHYFNTLRTGSRVALPAELHNAGSAKDLLQLVKPYLDDSVQSVRIKSRELLFIHASTTALPDVRRQAINYLLITTQPSDPTTTGLVLSRISAFDRDDFSDTAKANVRRLVLAEGSHLGEWFRVAAFLGMTDLIPHIRPYTQPGNRQSLRWPALLSLARLEEPSAAAEVVKRVKKLPVNDDLVYNIFPDLIFTRDRSAIGYMIEILFRDTRNCLSADAERETPIPCGYRIMEQLAPVIEGFPVQLDAAGDIQTDDYAAALDTVQQWLLAHRNYHIKKERY